MFKEAKISTIVENNSELKAAYITISPTTPIAKTIKQGKIVGIEILSNNR